MRIRISGKWLVSLVLLAIAASVFLLWATAVTIEFWRQYQGDWSGAPIHHKILTYLNLSAENNVAAWFSSMLLAAIGHLAILCFLLDRRRADSTWLAYGWLIMALGFIALSFDELASLHERLPLPENLGGYILWYAPVMAVLPTYMGLFAFSRMRGDKPAFLLIVLGSLAFASIPIQEHFEVGVLRADDWQRPVFQTLLEEGSELLAMLAIMTAFVRYVLRFLPDGPASEAGIASLRIGSLPFLASIVTALAAGLLFSELASRVLPHDHSSGIVRHWLPAWTCFGAACLAWHASARASPAGNLVFGQLAALCVALSVFIGASLYVYSSLVVVLCAWVALTWATGAFLLRSPDWIIGSGLWGASVIAAFTLLSGAVMPGAVALSTLLLLPALAANSDAGRRWASLRSALSV